MIEVKDLGTTKKSRPQLLRLYRNEFPKLTVEVVERFTNSFNCIAWTIGVRDRWVWNEVDMNNDGLASFSEFISFYNKHGLMPTTIESEADSVSIEEIKSKTLITPSGDFDWDADDKGFGNYSAADREKFEEMYDNEESKNEVLDKKDPPKAS